MPEVNVGAAHFGARRCAAARRPGGRSGRGELAHLDRPLRRRHDGGKDAVAHVSTLPLDIAAAVTGESAYHPTDAVMLLTDPDSPPLVIVRVHRARVRCPLSRTTRPKPRRQFVTITPRLAVHAAAAFRRASARRISLGTEVAEAQFSRLRLRDARRPDAHRRARVQSARARRRGDGLSARDQRRRDAGDPRQRREPAGHPHRVRWTGDRSTATR